jgi:hypothetical protein
MDHAVRVQLACEGPERLRRCAVDAERDLREPRRIDDGRLHVGARFIGGLALAPNAPPQRASAIVISCA